MSAVERAVIVFAGALFDAPLRTNRQQIALRLADCGWRVLYVEPRLFTFRQLLGRFLGKRGRLRWLLRHLVLGHPHPNLWVLAQSNLISGSRRHRWIGRSNHLLFNAWNVRWRVRRLGFRAPVLLLYDPEAAEFLDDFPDARVVYDCVDDHRAQADAHGGNPQRVAAQEAAIARRARAIAVTTASLREYFAALHGNVHLAPNAAEVAAFITVPASEPLDLAAIPHPRIGMVGALDSYKLDIPLLGAVVSRCPAWQFVLVGPVEYAGRRAGATVRSLRSLPNVHVLGLKPAELVPAYVHAFDVAIIPYRESAYNRASFPLKFWEFLAAGKPVVASGLPSLAPYHHLVRRATAPSEFAAAIRDSLDHGGEGVEARVAEAKRHDWNSRVDQIERLIAS